jgi:glycosyltransferase involved in cell wall biosynthesis
VEFKNSNPSILIVLPVRNEEKYIARALDSVLRQDYKEWKICCQDNSSIDETARIVEGYTKKDGRILLRKIQGNLNAANSSITCANWALNEVKSDLVMWFAGDDYLMGTDYLSKLVHTLQKNPPHNVIVAPNFILQSEEIPSNSTNFAMKLHAKNTNLRLRAFFKTWLNVCVMYGLYNRTLFEKLNSSEKSKFSNYLGSDWWWAYYAVKECTVINAPSLFRKTHHEGGWRHDKVDAKIRKNLLSKFINLLEIRLEFIVNHFLRQK